MTVRFASRIRSFPRMLALGAAILAFALSLPVLVSCSQSDSASSSAAAGSGSSASAASAGEAGSQSQQAQLEVWAHRGCSKALPENTMDSFRAALNTGAYGIETDVQLSSDGVPVIIHDETVDRCWNASGNVKDFTLDELQKMQLRSAYQGDARIPTLEDLLQLMVADKTGKHLNIELKNSEVEYPGMEEKVIALVDKYGLQDRVLYSSFSEASVARLKKLVPNAEIGALADIMSDAVSMARNAGVGVVHVDYPAFEGGANDSAKKAIQDGFTVRVWSQGREPFYGGADSGFVYDTAMLQQAGVKGFFTNEPERYAK